MNIEPEEPRQPKKNKYCRTRELAGFRTFGLYRI